MEKTNRSSVIAGGTLLLLIAFLIKGIPVLNGVILTFKDYNPARGLAKSQFVGFDNIAELLSGGHFGRVVFNTLEINLLTLAMAMALGALLAVSLGFLDKKAQNIFLAVIFIPLFIPGSTLVHICFSWFQGTMVLTRSQCFPFICSFLLAAKNAGIPAVLMLKTWQIRNRQEKPSGFERLIAPLAFVLIQLTSVLNSDMDVMTELLNPLVYQTTDTLDHYAFRTGLMSMKVGTSLSIWLFQLLVQLLLGLLVFLILRAVTKQEREMSWNGEPALPEKQQYHAAGFIIPSFYALLLAWFVLKPLIVDGLAGILKNPSPLSPSFFMSYVQYVFLYGFTALIGVPISVLLAKSCNTSGGFGKISCGLLAFLLIAGGMGIHQFLFIKSLGLVNTVFSLVLYYLFPLTNSLVLAAVLSFRKKDSTEAEGDSFVWKTAFTLGLIHFITMWNSHYIPLVFLSKPDSMPPVLLARMAAQGAGGGPVSMETVLGLDLLVTVLPIALFLLLRRFVNEWVLLAYTRVKQ